MGSGWFLKSQLSLSSANPTKRNGKHIKTNPQTQHRYSPFKDSPYYDNLMDDDEADLLKLLPKSSREAFRNMISKMHLSGKIHCTNLSFHIIYTPWQFHFKLLPVQMCIYYTVFIHFIIYS